MKIKTILRMLLMALMLLGTNKMNAADPVTMWPENGTSGSHAIDTYGNALKFSTAALATEGAGFGDVIRIVGTSNGDWGIYLQATPDYDWTRKEVYSANGGPISSGEIDIPLTESMISELTEGRQMAFLAGYNLTVANIFLIKIDGSFVNITQTTGGTVTSDKLKVSSGETVTLTVVPADDYQFESISVQSNGNSVTTERTGYQDYSFLMPSADVDVQAVFTAINYDIIGRTTVWDNPYGKAINWWGNHIELSTRYFENASSGWTIRVYGSGNQMILKAPQGNENNWQPLTGETTNENGYIDLVIDAASLERLQAFTKYIVTGSDFTVTKIDIIPSAPDTPAHVVTYIVDNEQWNRKQVEEGADIPQLTPTKTGYTFAGWSNWPEDGKMGTEDIELTAQFTVNSYTLTFKIDGQADQTSTVQYGTAISYPTDPVKEGYTFTGWDNTITTMPANDVTITAQFKKAFTLREGETVVWDGNPAIVYGGENNLFIYNTDNWVADTEKDGTLRIYADIDNPNDWKLWTGGGNWTHPTFVNVNDNLYQTSTFNGYNASAGCFEFVFNQNTSTNLQNYLSEGKAMSISFRNITIYLVTYEPPVAVPTHTLTITIDGESNDVLVEEGADLSDVLPTLTKEGYTFTGWKDNEGNDLPATMPASDLSVVAQFTVNSYILSYKVDGAAYGESQEVEYGTAISSIDEPERTGYTFSGWLNMPATMPAHDVTIEGYFTKNKVYTTLAVGSSRYATYCTSQPLYFMGSETVKAYIAKAKNETTVTLVQVVGTVAAGTGLVLVGSEANASARIEVVETGNTLSSNLMVGVSGTAYTANSSNQYVLVEKDGTVKFADTANRAATVPVGKAYLQAPETDGSRVLSIIFEDDETTGIEIVGNSGLDRSQAVPYNLRAQRVQHPTKGLYIIRGKKFFIK